METEPVQFFLEVVEQSFVSCLPVQMRSCYSGRIGQDLSLVVAGSFDLELGGLVSKSLDEDPQIPCRDTLQRDRAGLVLSRRCSQAVCGDFASRLLVKMRPCWSGRTSFRRKSSAGSLEGKLVNPPP